MKFSHIIILFYVCLCIPFTYALTTYNPTQSTGGGSVINNYYSNLSIGSNVTGSIANGVLFVDTNKQLAQSPYLNYSNGRLTILSINGSLPLLVNGNITADHFIGDGTLLNISAINNGSDASLLKINATNIKLQIVEAYGQNISFTHPDATSVCDNISETICISRGSLGGLYNTVYETDADLVDPYPTFTEWVNGTCKNAVTNLLTFGTWFTKVSEYAYGDNVTLVKNPQCMHTTDGTNKYYDIKYNFSAYYDMTGETGFKWNRSLYVAPELTNITTRIITTNFINSTTAYVKNLFDYTGTPYLSEYNRTTGTSVIKSTGLKIYKSDSFGDVLNLFFSSSANNAASGISISPVISSSTGGTGNGVIITYRNNQDTGSIGQMSLRVPSAGTGSTGLTFISTYNGSLNNLTFLGSNVRFSDFVSNLLPLTAGKITASNYTNRTGSIAISGNYQYINRTNGTCSQSFSQGLLMSATGCN